jgi:hypothetical protein
MIEINSLAQSIIIFVIYDRFWVKNPLSGMYKFNNISTEYEKINSRLYYI